MEKLFTVFEVADKLQIKIPTLYCWVAQNKIEHIRIGRLIRFTSGQLEEFLRRMTHGEGPDSESEGHEHEQNGKGK